MKMAEKELLAGRDIEGISRKYEGNFNIKYLVDVIWEDVGEKIISAKVKKPLKDLKPVCHYGCLTVRPPRITDARNPEDPRAMDNIIKSLGADVKNWSYKTDCCGGNLMLIHPELAKRLVKKLFDQALEAGADCFVVGCPLCQPNLDTRQKEILQDNGVRYNIPIFYFTE